MTKKHIPVSSYDGANRLTYPLCDSSSSFRRSYPRRLAAGGFTLIELLAVLAIVAVLSVLLMAGVNRVANAGKEAKCLANLRVIGSAMRAYMSDYEYGPPHVNAAFFDPVSERVRRGPWSWMTFLAPYLGSPDYAGPMSPVFDCPSDPNVKLVPKNRPYEPTGPDDRSNKFSSYGYNYIAFTTSRSSWANGLAANAANPDHDGSLPRPKIMQIRNAASLFLVTDGRPNEANPISDAIVNGNPLPSSPSPRHQGKFNVVFLDGHVQQMAAEEGSKWKWYQAKY